AADADRGEALRRPRRQGEGRRGRGSRPVGRPLGAAQQRRVHPQPLSLSVRLAMLSLSTGLSRRGFLQLTAGVSMSGWFGRLAADAAKDPHRKRSCILLWMAGGPAQTDTFDLKPEHKNGGPFK